MDNRFEVVEQEVLKTYRPGFETGSSDGGVIIRIIRDKKTGVIYLSEERCGSTAITPLLDNDGKPMTYREIYRRIL